MKKTFFILFALLCIAPTYADPLHPVYSRPAKVSTVQPPDIKEASGISLSKKNPGIAWIHNDSGNKPIVWGIRVSDGSCIARITMVGASNQDIEDIALGTYGGEETLFLADIGNNSFNRTVFYINVLPEPDISGMSNCQNITTTVKKIKFKYPSGGAYNAEALMFSQEFQKLYVIIKALKTEMFEFTSQDTTPGVMNYLQSIGKIPLQTVTGADMSRDGQGLILRTYKAIHEARKTPGEDVIQFLHAPLVGVPAPSEPQGEAVGYDMAGNYYTVSEHIHPPIYKITRLQ